MAWLQVCGERRLHSALRSTVLHEGLALDRLKFNTEIGHAC